VTGKKARGKKPQSRIKIKKVAGGGSARKTKTLLRGEAKEKESIYVKGTGPEWLKGQRCEG